MNIQEIYQKATVGNITIDKNGNPLLTNPDAPAQVDQDFIREKAAWLASPMTLTFFTWVQAKIDETVELASNASLSPRSDLDIRLLMVQHNTLKHLLDYARRNNDNNNS